MRHLPLVAVEPAVRDPKVEDNFLNCEIAAILIG